MDDEGILELFSGFNKLMDGLQVEPDEKPLVRLSVKHSRRVRPQNLGAARRFRRK